LEFDGAGFSLRESGLKTACRLKSRPTVVLPIPRNRRIGMDVRTYYQRIRETEATIPTQFTVVISLPTDDGGKNGVQVEVPRHLAAKMVVEGSAKLATADEIIAFKQSQADAYQAALDAATAAKVEVTMVSSDELKKLADEMKKLKAGAKVTKE
jgi:hypothetical protein